MNGGVIPFLTIWSVYMNDKEISPLAIISHIGAAFCFIGWLISIYYINNTQLHLWLLIVPISHILHSLFSDRKQTWYNQERIMGIGSAFTYLISAMSALVLGSWLFTNWNHLNTPSLGGSLLLEVGFFFILLQFILNEISFSSTTLKA